MEFKEAIQSAFAKYLTFSGRASRSEYWYWVLFMVVGNFLLSLIAAVIPLFTAINGLFALVTIIPGVAVWVRRLHDLNRSGWWIISPVVIGGVLMGFASAASLPPTPNKLLLLVALCWGMWVAYFWPAYKGTQGDNRFGPNPLASRP